MITPLKDYRLTWQKKPVLRVVYSDFFDRIALRCGPGPTLEIGGGIGNSKDQLPGLLIGDVQYAPWLDLVADAQRLPFAEGVLGNLVMLDVLHHLEFPILFFREAARTLRPSGRIVMIEPAITWGSYLFYRLMHHEPTDMTVDPLVEGTPDSKRNPYDSNQALPTLIATKYRNQFHRLIPDLQIIETSWFSFFAYPLSGGFKRWSLMPRWLAPPILRWEKALESVGAFFAFRLLITIEKRAGVLRPDPHRPP